MINVQITASGQGPWRDAASACWAAWLDGEMHGQAGFLHQSCRQGHCPPLPLCVVGTAAPRSAPAAARFSWARSVAASASGRRPPTEAARLGTARSRPKSSAALTTSITEQSRRLRQVVTHSFARAWRQETPLFPLPCRPVVRVSVRVTVRVTVRDTVTVRVGGTVVPPAMSSWG